MVENARQEGFEIGFKIGLEEGIKIGRQTRNLEISKNLKQEGIPTVMMTKSTGLTEKQINAL